MVDAMVVAWIPACAGMTEGGAGMTEGGVGPTAGMTEGGGSQCNEEEARRLGDRRAVGRFEAWLTRWWSHGFLPAQE